MGTLLDNGELPDVDTATEASPTGDVQLVGLSSASLAALENVTAALDAATLAALETITVANLLNPHPVSGTVSVGNLPATQPVSGTVGVSNFPATQPVTGTFWQATQPVSGSVDVTDRAGREAGRVRVWDGTDEATVLSRGTVPSSADKGLCVVSLNQPRPSYQAVTTEITSGTAVAVARSLSIWHPAALAKDVYILEIGANVGVQHTAGRFAFELTFISAESATGTAVTAQQLDRSQPASGLSIRQAVTAETATGAIFQRAVQGPSAAATPQGTNYDGVVIYRAKDLDDYSDAILLRNGQAEGLLVRQNILATLTTAPIFSVYARWVERA